MYDRGRHDRSNSIGNGAKRGELIYQVIHCTRGPVNEELNYDESSLSLYASHPASHRKEIESCQYIITMRRAQPIKANKYPKMNGPRPSISAAYQSLRTTSVGGTIVVYNMCGKRERERESDDDESITQSIDRIATWLH